MTNSSSPECVLFGGPNGAGKTTLARAWLRTERPGTRFFNVDELAATLSPWDPQAAAVEAGKRFLGQLEEAVARRESFAFESTLSGSAHARRLRKWKESGYRLVRVYVTLASVDLSRSRVRHRVFKKGHDVPEADIP